MEKSNSNLANGDTTSEGLESEASVIESKIESLSDQAGHAIADVSGDLESGIESVLQSGDGFPKNLLEYLHSFSLFEWVLLGLVCGLAYALFGYIRSGGESILDGLNARTKEWFRFIIRKFRGVIQFFNTVFGSQEWKYEDSWFLTVALDDVDLKSIINQLNADRLREKNKRERSLRISNASFLHLSRGALVVPNEKDLEKSTEVNHFYRSICSELVQYRPERPLDGLILVVNASSFTPGNSRSFNRCALDYAEIVNNIQDELEFSLPIYVLLADCQEITGFSDFWSVQKASYDWQQPFGWKSNYSSSTKFSRDHIDEAMMEIEGRLNSIQLQTDLGNSSDLADGFLRFPGNLSNLKAGLRSLALAVFQGKAGAFVFLRGIYFCGKFVSDDKEQVAFIDQVIDSHVLVEPIVAEPTRKRILSRNTFVYRFQILTVLLTMVASTWLFFTNRHLDSQVQSITNIIDNLNRWEHSDLENCENLNTVEEIYGLLSNMAIVDADPKYFSIPISWFDDVSGRVDAKMSSRGMNTIVLPNIECQLIRQAENLVEMAMNVDGNLASHMDQYVQQVIRFENNLRAFGEITPKQLGPEADTRDSMSILVKLMESIYHKAPPKILSRVRGQHQNSLILHEYTPRWSTLFRVDAVSEAVEGRCGQVNWEGAFNARKPISVSLLAFHFCRLGQKLYDQILSRSQLNQVGGGSTTALLAYLQSHPYQSYQAVVDWDKFRSDYFTGITLEGLSPCDLARKKINGWVSEIGGLYPSALKTIWQETEKIYDKDGKCEKDVSLSMINVESILLGVDQANSNRSNIIREFIESSKKVGFFSPHGHLDSDVMTCQANLDGWDDSQLNIAQDYIREYQLFVKENNLVDKTLSSSPLKKLAYFNLRSTLNNTFYDAQRSDRKVAITANKLTNINRQEATLAMKMTEFQLAVEILVPVIKDLENMGMKDTRTALAQCARKYAYQLVESVDRFAKPLRLYGDLPRDLAFLDLESDYNFKYHSTGELEKYFEDEQNRTRIILSYMEPALVLLGETAQLDGVNWQEKGSLTHLWSETLMDFERFQRELGNTELDALGDLYGNLVESDNVCELIIDNPNGYGDSLFSKRRSRLEMSLGQQCDYILLESIRNSYEFLRREFNDHLANRFPFSRFELGQKEASAARVRQFFVDNETVIEQLYINTERFMDKDSGWREVNVFLSELRDIASFFNTNLTQQPRSNPLILDVQFNLEQTSKLLDRHTTIWTLGSDRYETANTDESNEFIWHFGDPLHLDVSWSADSKFSIEDSHGQNVFSLSYEGDWALLKLLKQYSIEPNSEDMWVGELEKLLRITIDVGLKNRKDSSISAKRLAEGPFRSTHYLSILPKVEGPKGDLTALRLPSRFPTLAPKMPGSTYAYH